MSIHSAMVFRAAGVMVYLILLDPGSLEHVGEFDLQARCAPDADFMANAAEMDAQRIGRHVQFLSDLFVITPRAYQLRHLDLPWGQVPAFL